MSGGTPLTERLAAEFDQHTARLKTEEETRAKESAEHADRLAKFEQACEELRSVWKPRIEEFAGYFGDKISVEPSVSPGHREAKAVFMTELANITLTLTVSLDADFKNIVLDYDLLIIPIYFQYERHSRMETPLDAVDSGAVGQWLDDRLVACVQAYLSIQENEYYRRRALVEDPITNKRLLPENAAATIEHKGRTVYFANEDSLRQYKEKHMIEG